MLNGRIDVFPAGDRARWTHDPLSGAIVDGRLHGLGTVDMKCGTTASIFTYAYLGGLARRAARPAHPDPRLRRGVPADGGAAATSSSITPDEVLGDCVLNGEPSSPHTIRFGEKAMVWLKLSIRTPGGHSAYPHVSKSANRIAAALVRDLESLEALVPATPEKVARALGGPDVRAGAERGLGAGAAEFLEKVTRQRRGHAGRGEGQHAARRVRARGGRPPAGRRLTATTWARDRAYRRPLPGGGVGGGREPARERDLVGSRARDGRSPPGERAGVPRVPAARLISLGGTDCRFWRAAGTPAYVYGPSPAGMGAPNESVDIEEFLHVVRTHTLSAFDYLSRA